VRTRSFMPLLIAVAALGTACADHSRLLTPPPPPPPAPGAVQLVFTRGPGDILAGYVMPPVEVAPVRASGETDPSGNITIDLDANGSGATLAGTTTARAIGGVAVFTDLRIGEPGSAVRLRAAAAGLREREQLAIRGSRRSKSRHARLVFGSCLQWGDEWGDVCAWGAFVVLKVDGSEHRLPGAAGPHLEFDPAWSPDGTRIAFAGYRHCTPENLAQCNSAIYVMNADGSEARRLESLAATQGYSSGVSWSPDGERLAFTRWDLPAATLCDECGRFEPAATRQFAGRWPRVVSRRKPDRLFHA